MDGEMKWRPIAEAPDSKRVLVYDREYGTRIGFREGDRWWSGYDSYGNDVELHTVIRFALLPEPPRD